MAGRNQHYIPQFILRNFGDPNTARKNRAVKIWKYKKGSQATECDITDTAAEDCFYSTPMMNTTTTLDDIITRREAHLSKKFQKICTVATGHDIAAEQATYIIIHLAQRTSHIRDTFQYAMNGIVEDLSKSVSSHAGFEYVLGIHNSSPTEHFREIVMGEIYSDPKLNILHIPRQLLEKIIFRLLKENSKLIYSNQIDSFANGLEQFTRMIPAIVRGGHNNALKRTLDMGNYRKDLLRMRWSVSEHKSKVAVLPDCVVLGITNTGEPQPFMQTDKDNLSSIILPLSPSRYLIGRSDPYSQVNIENYNSWAAACSSRKFYAPTRDTSLLQLTGIIGTRSFEVMEEALSFCANKHSNAQDKDTSVCEISNQKTNSAFSSPLVSTNSDFSFQLSFPQHLPPEHVQKISNVIQHIVYEYSKIVPLSRLDQMTISNDFFARHNTTENHCSNIEITGTADDVSGAAIAMTLPTNVGGVLKGHIYLSTYVASSLLSDGPAFEMALYIVTYELTLIAMTDYVESKFPDASSLLHTEDQHLLYPCINSALGAYVAARKVANVGDWSTNFSFYNLQLQKRLAHAQTFIPEVRRAYPRHGDINKLLSAVLPMVSQTLEVIARLLGHCDAQGAGGFSPDSELLNQLETLGLRTWLPTFNADLGEFYANLGLWKSFTELTTFIQHAERILWSFGIFVWLTPDGKCRVELSPEEYFKLIYK